MIGILGSGFGLYGYLPAICQYYPNKSILLVNKAKLILNSRSELSNYKRNIIWKENYEDIIKSSDFLIVAYPPFETQKLIKLILASSKIKKIIVEKPICDSPEKALFFLNQMNKANINIASSFIFIYTEWFNFFENHNDNIKIHWQIVNINHENSWKWNPNLGGGIINFYGIHLLSVCAYLGFSLKIILNNSKSSFEAVFQKQSQELKIKINYSKSKSFFNVNNIKVGETPFGNKNPIYKEDFRVSYINKLLIDFNNNSFALEELARETVLLWQSVIVFNTGIRPNL